MYQFFFQVLFLLYLFLPQTYGALIMYDRFVDPAITALDEMMQKYTVQTAGKKEWNG